MLLPILLAASLQASPQVSLVCTNSAATQTQPVPGPGGVVAVLKVSTEDDHSKNSHLCNAEYQLLLISGAGGTPRVVELLTSDDDYSRGLSLRLSGFSQDGKHVFGVFSETGKHPFTMLFDYRATDGSVQLIDITKQFAPIMPAHCSSTLEVFGTTATGTIVLELHPAKQCAFSRRWLLDSSGNRPQPLSQDVPILRLYEPQPATP